MHLATPKYIQLSGILRDGIKTGAYTEGTRLPPELKLAAEYGMSRQTVRQAIRVLEEEGLVTTRQGSGSTVLRQKATKKKTPQPAVPSNHIYLISTYITDYIFPSIIRGVESELSKEDYPLTVTFTENRPSLERNKLQQVLESGAAGLIIEPTRSSLPCPNLDLYEEIHKRGIPIVFIHSWYRELPDSVHVVTDDFEGGRQAVLTMDKAGHRDICGIFKSDDMQGTERYRGFIQGLRNIGQSFSDDTVMWFDETNETELYSSERLLSISDRCTALVCYNDLIALKTAEALTARGVDIPEDLSIISFDNSSYAGLGAVKLTSLSHPKDRLGATAARKLLNMIHGKSETSEAMPFDLVERESIKTL